MVPLPNFITYQYETEEITGNLSKFLYCFKKILFPIGYKKLENQKFSSFLQIIQNIEHKSLFFEIPAMEAIMTSRWRPTKFYWQISFALYFIYLGLFSYLSWFYLEEKRSVSKATKVM